MFRSFITRFQSPPTLAAIAAIVLFVAVLAWWTWIFHTPAPQAPARPAPPPSIDASAGATLFGAEPDRGRHDQVQLLGILAFDPKHAAAIISVGDGATHVVRLNGAVADATTLHEVRAHSIIVERNGIQREIALPAAQSPSAFMH
ncbi:type II secretion system protein N [Paraburkholderia sp. BCC1885]|uniref:type II secretion system protein N n=1 Tax=Paraburkholderia sp. BCC1885 TaxID=2562669 RepID=UPI0011840612|nr:type II secretion system protein N [Paraburkholderia sp. BCC1885]